jgi:hypothetical protein
MPRRPVGHGAQRLRCYIQPIAERVTSGCGDPHGRRTYPIALSPRLRARRCAGRCVVRLGVLGRHEEEIVAYSEVERRFGGAEELALREPVAKALFNKGIQLGKLDRIEQQVALYKEIERRYGNAELPENQEVLARVRSKLADER